MKRRIVTRLAWRVGVGLMMLGAATVLLAQAGGPPSADQPPLPVGQDPATALAVNNPGRRSAEASTADHTRFEQLKGPFATGPEVTAACLTCHTQASKQIMQTSHWTWICPRAREELASRQRRAVGKGEHVINNFCIALGSNEPRCTSCHAGYGWADKTFDFDDQTRVDCLVCHDTTRSYRKFPTAAGHPVYESEYPEGREWPKGSGNIWEPVDLAHVARHVGRPSRHTCGTCHFFGGGGEGVKHGDMDVTLDKPDRRLDVHMDQQGLDFRCTECHTTREHRIAGRCFTIPAYDQRTYVMRGLEHENNLLACEACHTATPHALKKINDHSDKVSCQACHIPTLARRRPTKMWWDWSEAGRMNDQGKPFSTKAPVTGPEGQARLIEQVGPDGKVSHVQPTAPTYDSKKGQFIWAIDAVPEYRWFNGQVSHTFLGDKVDDQTPGCEHEYCITQGRYDRIDTTQPVVHINTLQGSYHDPNARIWPVKIHRGKQPYDRQLKTLVAPKLFPSEPNAEHAFWKSFNWDRAIAAGMNYLEQPYSGEFGWIQTEMSWPLAHMVAPAEQALDCVDCHHPEGRLAALGGFYMPGRDTSAALDWLGIALIVGAIGGSLIHGTLRMVWRPKPAPHGGRALPADASAGQSSDQRDPETSP